MSEIVADARLHQPRETGGILLGREHGGRIVVTHQIGAGPNAVHNPKSFTPDRDWQYDRIDTLYVEAHGNIAYLGDWHTHPGGVPEPSRTDRTLLRRTAQNPDCQCAQPVMLILGDTENDGRWNAAAYRHSPSHRMPKTRLIEVRIE